MQIHCNVIVKSHNTAGGVIFSLGIEAVKIHSRYCCISIVTLVRLDQYKYVCSLPGQYLWKLEINVEGTTTTVISAGFRVPCQVAALLLTEYRRLLTPHRRHLENTFAFSQRMLSLDEVEIITSPPHLI